MNSTKGHYVEWLKAEIDYWERYHNHKETMAWVATTFYLSGIIGLAFGIRNLTESIAVSLLILLVLALFGTMFCFLRMQFDARYKAHTTIIGLRRAMVWLLARTSELTLEDQIIERRRLSHKRYWWPNFVQTEICCAQVEESRLKFGGVWSEVATYVAVAAVTFLAALIIWSPSWPKITTENGMIALLAIGFGMFVLGLCLMTVRNTLRRTGRVPMALTNIEVRKEGLVICAVGLVVLLVGIFSEGLSNLEARVLTDTGASVMYLGFLLLVQWTVQSGLGTECQVKISALVMSCIGFLLILAYAAVALFT